MIITMMGLDGAGKTTQLRQLERFFSRKKLRTGSIFDVKSEETYSSLSEMQKYYDYLEECDVVFSRFFLKSPETMDALNKVIYGSERIFENPDMALKAFELCRADAEIWHREVITPLDKLGKTIIFDRYFFDEIAYRSLYSLSIDALFLSYKKSSIREPDWSFYLELPLGKLIMRNESRSDSSTPLFQSREKLKELLEAFDFLKKKYKIFTLDADQQVDVLTRNILKTIGEI